MIYCLTSWQLWDKLHEHFLSIACAKKKQIQGELRSISLDNCSITAYLLHIQTLLDSLLLIGDSVSMNEHIDIILDGLHEEYETIVTILGSKTEPLTLDEVTSMLLAQESCLEKSCKKNLGTMNMAEATSISETQDFEA